MKKALFLFCFAVFTTSFAQDEVSTKEAGTYQRKSVALLNVRVDDIMDDKHGWNNEWSNSLFVNTLKNAVKLVRFDYNNIPQSIQDKFLAMPKDLSIEERMNSTIVNAVLSAVDAEKEIRAAALLSEQQKNSFITDKAKELGITENELNIVMNSAYIFAPVFLGYLDTNYTASRTVSKRNSDGSYTSYTEYYPAYSLMITLGGYWWKIDNSGDKPSAKLIAHTIRTYSGGASRETDGYKIRAFNSAMSNVGKDFEMATKEIPDFQLTAQILDKNPRNVVISLGKPEGVITDDKFWVYESYENSDGIVTQKKKGWVMIKKVGEKARGLDETQSKAQIIAGSPYLGATVRERPQLPIDIYLGFGMSPVNISTSELETDTLFQHTKENNDVRIDIDNTYGPHFRAKSNIGRKAGVSQLWLGVGGQLFFGGVDGKFTGYDGFRDSAWYHHKDYDTTYTYGNLKLFGFSATGSITKKLFIRRLVLAPEIGVGFKGVFISGEAEKKEFTKRTYEDGEYKYKDTVVDFNDKDSLHPFKNGSISNGGVGVTSDMNIELALAPSFHIGGSIGWHAFVSDDKWKYSHSRDRMESERDAKYSDLPKDAKGIEGPVLHSKDELKTSGVAWSAYLSFTVPHASKNNNDLVAQKDVSAPKPQSETDGQSSANDKYKSENDGKGTAPQNKQNGGAGNFFRTIFSL